jgi:ribosomal protein S18 acetylase RimI-like enzyme
MSHAAVAGGVKIRPLRMKDLDEVIRIDALHTHERKAGYWRTLLRGFLSAGGPILRIGLAAEENGTFTGYLLGEVRAFEFGSEPCGWIFAVGVDPHQLRSGIASRLLQEARKQFRREGVSKLRTMVRWDDIQVLSFFRSSGFVGGTFVQLEENLLEDQR